MVFYSPSQLNQDATRHKVVVRDVDVAISDGEAALEPTEVRWQAVRFGLNTITGMQREAAWRIEEARAVRAFISVDYQNSSP